jgi:hypothetical protein
MHPHEEGNLLFAEHKFFQSKHGIRDWIDTLHWKAAPLSGANKQS